ncbi:hypothetical protein L3X38_017626 [Prunus dulcis]|uniref:Uncharacterized protein n=1 Tax=Prunus dulcis TaxID=3755 RepID=A0AAD4W7I1_PRUDU|nr:hypothetical protein L3X38_017626 [Prunus dulcis]
MDANLSSRRRLIVSRMTWFLELEASSAATRASIVNERNSRPPVSHLHLQPQFLVLFFHLSFDNEIISSVLKKTRRPFSKPVDQNFAAISI